MIKEKSLVNIKCPMCETTLVMVEVGHAVMGLFRHKCAKCKQGSLLRKIA